MGDVTRPSVGAKAVIHFGEESAYGTLATLNHVLRFTSENISNEVNVLVSKELRSDRARGTSVRGSASVGGDVNVEQNMEGFGILLKHTLGYCKSLQYTDGGIAAILATAFDSTNDTTFVCDRDLETEGFLDTGGQGVILTRDDDFVLTAQNFIYSGISGTGKTIFDDVDLDGVGSLTDCVQGSRIFLRDTTNYSAIYTHVIDAVPDLPIGLSFEILRDIVAFVYTGCRVNQLTETFPQNDICTAVLSIMGKVEWSLGLLNVVAEIGDTTVELQSQEQYDGFPAGGGTLIIGTETDITYTGKSSAGGTFLLTGIPGAGDHSIEVEHAINEPVSLQSTTGTGTAVTTDMITSFMGSFKIDNTEHEVMSCEWTINNNLYPDKIPFGSKGRSRLPEQNREVSGSCNIEFDDMRMYSRFTEDIPAKLEIGIIDSRVEGEIGNTGVYRQKYIVFPRVKYAGATPVVGGPELITADMPFNAFPDDTNNLPEVYVILVNTEASY